MNTQDPHELAHFKRLSSTWWDEKGPFQLLHAMTPLRVSFILEKAARPLHGLRILDVGCGGGILCEPLARLGADVVGIDAVEENIRVAQDHGQALGLSIRYFAKAIEDLPPDLGPFDLVIASEILEHVTEPRHFLKACADQLHEHGSLYITTLNQTLKSYLFGILAAEYILGWAPRGTHTWGKFIPPHRLTVMLKEIGFRAQSLQGVRLSPLSKTWHFSSSREINYFLWGRKK